jgi:hypothetical protein
MLRGVLNRNFFIGTFFLAIFYLLLNVYMTNYLVINQTLFGVHDFSYKFVLIGALIMGLTTAMSGVSLLVLCLIALFSGANLVLVYRNLKNNLSQKSAQMAFGFGTIIGTAGSGCASCGLPLLGLLGISGSVGYLPFKGAEVSMVALGLLIFSFVILVRKQLQPCVVKIPAGH